MVSEPQHLTSAFDGRGTITLIMYERAPDMVWITFSAGNELRATESVRLADLVAAVQRLAVSASPELAMRAEASE